MFDVELTEHERRELAKRWIVTMQAVVIMVTFAVCLVVVIVSTVLVLNFVGS